LGSGRDLHGLYAGAGQDGVEGAGELPGPVADQEPEVRDPITGVHQEIADLLGGPRPVRVRGDPEDVYVTGADPAAGPLHPVGQSPLAGWSSSDQRKKMFVKRCGESSGAVANGL
jgi:hypothetical protein